jgi:hypothetical protein
MIKIFNTPADLKAYIPINLGFPLADLESDIDAALRQHILPLLSRGQFDDSKASTNATHIELMSIVKQAAANLAMFSYLPQGKVEMKGNSISYVVDKNRQASAEDKRELSDSFLKKGHAAVSDMIQFLEENQSVFTIWAASENYTIYADSYIRTAAEFKIIPDNNRHVFLRLKPHIETAEFELNQNLPTNIKEKLKSRDFGTNAATKAIWNDLLKNYIQVIVRSHALAAGILDMSIVIDVYGTITTFNNTLSSQTKAYAVAADKKIEKRIEQLRLEGSNRQMLLNQFLIDNATALGYTAPTTPPTSTAYKNDPTHRTVFI